jgi:hypothetical protein
MKDGEKNNMANHESKSSTEKSGVAIQKVICARKYDAFLKSICQTMRDNCVTDIDVCHLIDHHSSNYPGYAFLELTPDGLVANCVGGTVKVENVLDVLDDLDEPKQILRSLIQAIINGTDVNERIKEVELCLRLIEKAIKNSNVTSEPNNRIANDKNN